MFLPKLLVYYVFLYFAFNTDKRLIHKLCCPFGSSGRMFREEMWWYSRGCLWLLTVNGLCQRLGTLPPGAQYHALMENNQRFASVPVLGLTVRNVATWTDGM